MTSKDSIQKKYDQSRGNLMLIIIFTLINIALLFTSSNTMFLFSITIPYWSAAFAYILDLTGFYIVSGVVLLLYLACWFFSKKHYGWFVPALILFILDTIYLGYVTIDMGEGSNIIDILVHIWVLYYLISGIYFGYKLKRMPQDSSDGAAIENATPIRLAEDVKHRILAEAYYNAHHICYRRAKGVNELVVDNYIYDEYKKLIEFPHTLTAQLDDVKITAGYNGSHSYITANGVEIARKVRIV